MEQRWAPPALLALEFIKAAASVVIAVVLGLLLWGAQGSSGAGAGIYDESALFPEVEVSDFDGLVVIEVVLVDGVGPEEREVTLGAGIWRATTEAVDSSIDDTHIVGTSERGSRLSWSSDESRPAYFVVGDFGQSQATLYGREFIVRTNAVIEDHPWSVTLERFGIR